jgi:hypothetical protein
MTGQGRVTYALIHADSFGPMVLVRIHFLVSRSLVVQLDRHASRRWYPLGAIRVRCLWVGRRDSPDDIVWFPYVSCTFCKLCFQPQSLTCLFIYLTRPLFSDIGYADRQDSGAIYLW